MENNNPWIWKVITGVFLCLLLVYLFAFYSLDKNNRFYKNILKLGVDYKEEDIANNYYETAGLYYERQEYLLVESNCKSAREHYSLFIQELKREQAKIKDRTEKIFLLFDELMEYKVIMNENLYESCEWLESAARHYNYYYKPTTPIGDPSFEQGGVAIERMNEKIIAHDNAVRRYNSILEEYNLELEKVSGK